MIPMARFELTGPWSEFEFRFGTGTIETFDKFCNGVERAKGVGMVRRSPCVWVHLEIGAECCPVVSDLGELGHHCIFGTGLLFSPRHTCTITFPP